MELNRFHSLHAIMQNICSLLFTILFHNNTLLCFSSSSWSSDHSHNIAPLSYQFACHCKQNTAAICYTVTATNGWRLHTCTRTVWPLPAGADVMTEVVSQGRKWARWEGSFEVSQILDPIPHYQPRPATFLVLLFGQQNSWHVSKESIHGRPFGR